MRCEARRGALRLRSEVARSLSATARVSFYFRLRFGTTFTVCVIETGRRPQKSL